MKFISVCDKSHPFFCRMSLYCIDVVKLFVHATQMLACFQRGGSITPNGENVNVA